LSILNTQFNSLRAFYDFFRLSSCFRLVTRLLSTNINIFLVSINCFSYTHKYRWAFKPCISKCKKIVCASVLPLRYNWTLAKYLTIKHLNTWNLLRLKKTSLLILLIEYEMIESLLNFESHEWVWVQYEL